MTDAPKPEQIVDITGPAGETIFWHGLEHVVAEYQSEFQGRLDELWAHYQDISDERLLALVGALCVERSIQAILEAFGPGFDKLQDDTDFTFSLKIKTVRALRIIPSRILTACDLIRQIRNEFAHHLEKKTFGQLDPDKYLQKLKAQANTFNPKDRANAGYEQIFRVLVGFTLIALGAYAQHARRLREYLKTGAFHQDFMEWSKSSRSV